MAEEMAEEAQAQPLLGNDESFKKTIRTGTLWTASAHIITGVIGSGVLSLAWSVGQLGWIGGPISMLFFAGVTIVQSGLLADCYRSHDHNGPRRHRSYMEAVKHYLGEKHHWASGFFQQTTLFGCAVAYIITAGTSMRAIQMSNCYHKEGHEAPCKYEDSYYMLVFGGVQIILSLIPDFHEMVFLSTFAAIMSFVYSSIGFGLGLAKVIGNGGFKGSIRGIPAPSPMQKTWRISQALGDVAFAYPYSIIPLEIENTLRSPPPENETMKKASKVSIFITTFFYLCCGCFGYAAFGDQTPGNLLTGFGFYEPYWLVDIANTCIVLHLLGGYQVYSQPMFSFIERWYAENFPDNTFLKISYPITLPHLPTYDLKLARLLFRTIYVLTTTFLAICFPYFNQVLGLLGSFGFWPMAIYFPVEMYFVQKRIPSWSKEWIKLRIFSIVCLILSIFAFVGSLQGIISKKIR